ncbi:hypothetical protein V5O48_011277 [Marasmius crinis-equi]|uniref:F-box domain-containing protein n=1 Tax=Marasmius crinis-equi TaxID=585013 RepID=A0ABR3F6G3_9AGAR
MYTDRQSWAWINFDKKEHARCVDYGTPLNSTCTFHDTDVFMFLRRLVRLPPDPLEAGNLEEGLTVNTKWLNDFIFSEEEKKEADRLWKAAQTNPSVVLNLEEKHPYMRLMRRRTELEAGRSLPHNAPFQGRVSIHDLPSEIHLDILDYIPQYYFVLSFALTSRGFWNLAKPRLAYLLRNSVWAGDRIVCYETHSGELPSFFDNISEDLGRTNPGGDGEDNGDNSEPEVTIPEICLRPCSEVPRGSQNTFGTGIGRGKSGDIGPSVMTSLPTARSWTGG